MEPATERLPVGPQPPAGSAPGFAGLPRASWVHLCPISLSGGSVQILTHLFQAGFCEAGPDTAGRVAGPPPCRHGGKAGTQAGVDPASQGGWTQPGSCVPGATCGTGGPSRPVACT